MNVKRKVMAGLVTILASISLISVGTYAYFNAKVANMGNKFQASSLVLNGFRNDVPIEGPMFYTTSDFTTPNGIEGIGLWKPGDSHTRAMFVENNGTISAKLRGLTITPYGSTNLADLEEFARQSTLTVAVIKRDSNIPCPESGVSVQTAYALFVKQYEQAFGEALDQAWANLPPALSANMKFAWYWTLGEVKKSLIAQTFEVPVDGVIHTFYIEQVYQGSMYELVNKIEPVSNPDFYVNPGEARYFGYTVTLQNLAPEENNKVNGKEIQLNFIQDWIQK